jgi:class 3 adenylate cyclase
MVQPDVDVAIRRVLVLKVEVAGQRIDDRLKSGRSDGDDAVRCAVEVQTAMIERNAGVPPERRIEFRVGIHLGDVVEESDGDLMGDGVNIAARLEGIAKPGAICLSEDVYRQGSGPAF